MGAYIYSLRGPKNVTEITLPDGRVAVAGQIKYSHKPLRCLGPEPLWQRLAEARIAKMERAWGDKTPEFVVVVSDEDKGKLREGHRVLEWHRQTLVYGDGTRHSVSNTNIVSTWDDPDWGGRKTVGRLKRVGKSWQVVPN